MEEVGFAPHNTVFPAKAKTRYRCMVVVPLMAMLLLVTSIPFLVGSMVSWGNGCWHSEWYERSSTYSVLGNIVQVLAGLGLAPAAMARMNDGPRVWINSEDKLENRYAVAYAVAVVTVVCGRHP